MFQKDRFTLSRRNHDVFYPKKVFFKCNSTASDTVHRHVSECWTQFGEGMR